MLKILAPYVPLSACFAALHARLRLPPFALFLVSLTLTDGARPTPAPASLALLTSRTRSHDRLLLLQRPRRGLVARDRAEHLLLLHHEPALRVCVWCLRGGRVACRGHDADGAEGEERERDGVRGRAVKDR
jgi:hypothetical protein